MRYGLGIDLGGTKILGAIVDENGAVKLEVRHDTDPARWGQEVAAVIEELLAGFGGPVASIGVAVAGFVEQPAGVPVFTPNLSGADPELRSRLSRLFGLPVLVENDANAAAWGEYRLGAGKGSTDMIMVTVGTGIGGGIVAGGRLYRGSRGFAGEFGHVPVTLDGPVCSCGSQGCLEAVASGRALARMARERVQAYPDSAVLKLATGDTLMITGATVGKAADAQDPFALQLLRELGSLLGVGLAGLARAFDPEIIVLGGGVMQEKEPVLAAANDEVARRYKGQVEPPVVVAASLGNDAGVVGAALLSLQRSAA